MKILRRSFVLTLRFSLFTALCFTAICRADEKVELQSQRLLIDLVMRHCSGDLRSASDKAPNSARCREKIEKWKKGVQAIPEIAQSPRMLELLSSSAQRIIDLALNKMKNEQLYGKGKDWEEFKDIANGFIQYSRLQQQAQRSWGISVALPNLSINRLASRYFDWRRKVSQKLLSGFYIGERSHFYGRLLDEPIVETNQGRNNFRIDLFQSVLVHYENEKTPDKKHFFAEMTEGRSAQEHVEDKIAFYQTVKEQVTDLHQLAEVDRSLKKWSKRSNRVLKERGRAEIEYPNNSGGNVSHVDQIHGISALKNLGYTGRNVRVGVLEASGAPSGSQTRAEIQGHLTANSKAPDREGDLHGATMTSVISSNPPKTVYSQRSIAPESRVHYEYGTEGADLTWVSISPDGSEIDVRKWTGGQYSYINQYFLKGGRIDWDPLSLSERNTPTALKSLVDNQIDIISASRSLPIDSSGYLQEPLNEFSKRGGVIFSSLGNDRLAFILDKNGALQIDNQRLLKNRNPFSVLNQFEMMKHLSEEPQDPIRNSFIFIGALDARGTHIGGGSNSPGSFLKIAERSLFVVGAGYEGYLGTKGVITRGNDGSSPATAAAAATFALLKEAFPQCPNPSLAEAMLDSATYDGLEITLDGKMMKAEEMSPREKLQFFGRGKLNAKAAYDLAQEQKYCNAKPVLPSTKITVANITEEVSKASINERTTKLLLSPMESDKSSSQPFYSASQAK